jgi:uncharacterized surface protein with fasciclin (FAS1) repeats
MRRQVPFALAALLLAACGQGGGGDNVTAGEAESNLSAGTGTPSQDLAALVGASPRLARLIEAAGMSPVLSGKEPYTLLAPTDAALDALPAGSFERLSQPEQKAELTALLRAHILPGTILAADLARAVESGKGKATIATMAGEPLTITRDGDGYRIAGAGGAGARIVGTEQPARNGVVHQIDAVLAPASR